MFKRLAIFINAIISLFYAFRFVLCGVFMIIVIVLLTPFVLLHPKLMFYFEEETNKIIDIISP